MKMMNLYMFIFVKEVQHQIQQKYGLQKIGDCILANNNSRISEHDLNKLFKSIQSNFFYIVTEWKNFYGVDEFRYYC